MKTASRILGVMCLMIALVFLMPFLLMNVQNDAAARTISLVFYFPVALGPLGYLYCRSALLETPLVRRDLLHLIPWLLCYALIADIIIADPQVMTNLIMGAEPDNWRLQVSKYMPFTLAFMYAIGTGLMIWRYRRQANDNLANFDQSVFNWLLTLQAFSLAV